STRSRRSPSELPLWVVSSNAKSRAAMEQDEEACKPRPGLSLTEAIVAGYYVTLWATVFGFLDSKLNDMGFQLAYPARFGDEWLLSAIAPSGTVFIFAFLAHLAIASRRAPRHGLASGDWQRLGLGLCAAFSAVLLLQGLQVMH